MVSPDNNRTPLVGSNSSSNSRVNSDDQKPKGTPQASFKRVFEKKKPPVAAKDENDGEDDILVEDAETEAIAGKKALDQNPLGGGPKGGFKGQISQGGQGGHPSIFDLSRSGVGNEEVLAQFADEKLASDYTSKKGSLSPTMGKMKGPNQMMKEQPEMAALNPNVIPQDSSGIAANADAGATAKPAVSPQIQQIVDQIVNNMYTLKLAGQTDTVITLKNPPVLEGAQIVVTSFDHARGEFNIAFHNLTNAGQQLIDNQSNKAALQQGLEEKGYFVHIMVVTTNPIEASNVGYQYNGRGDREDQQGRQQEKEKEQEEQT